MILLRINWPNCVQFSIRLGERWALRIFQWSVTQKTSNPGKIQDSVKSMTGPINKRLSWKIQDGWSPYIILYRIVTSRLCRVYWHCSFGYSLTVCGSDIVYSCVLDVVCCPFIYSVSLVCFTVSYSHCFMLPRRSSPFGCTAAEFVHVSSSCIVANPCCWGDSSVMPIFCRLHLHAQPESLQLLTPPSGCTCAGVQRHLRCCLITSTLAELPHSLSTSNFSSCGVSFYYERSIV